MREKRSSLTQALTSPSTIKAAVEQDYHAIARIFNESPS
jgi:hypothetical protein